MNILAPSILSADFANLGSDISKTVTAGASHIHVDVMDGMFVPSISFGMPVLASVRACTDAFLDVHLMIEKPERYIEQFASLGADGITIHAESCEHVDEVLQKIRSLCKKSGLAISPDTPVETVYPYLDLAGMILIMTVYPGFGGQKYIDACNEKIRTLRDKLTREGRSIDIEIDGGVNRENITDILRQGANVIVAGSAIFKGDIADNTNYFLEKLK